MRSKDLIRNTGKENCFISSLIPLSDLSEPIDVYSDWIDACESANQ